MILGPWQRAFMTFSASLLMLVSFFGVSHADVLGYWTMDDDYPPGYFVRGTTADGSGNGNHGVLSDSVSVGQVTGYDGIGKAANFYAADPVAAIDCGTDPSIKPTSAGYSFATWVKFDDLTPYWQMIGGDWNDGGTAGDKWFYHFAVEQNNLVSLYLAEPGTDHIQRYVMFDSSEPVTTDTWTHVGFTVTPHDGTNPGEVILYRDGAVAAPVAAYNFSSLPYTSEPVVLGAKTSAGQNPLHGQLDQTAIWSSAISATDFANLANGTSPLSVSSSTLGGFWDYETFVPVAPTTATVTDSSGNGNNGLLSVNEGNPNPFNPAGGPFGGAVVLRNGDGRNVNLGDIDGMAEEMTISAWIKLDDPNSFNIVASQSDDSNNAEWAWQIFTSGGKAYFYVYNPAWDGTGDSFMLAGVASGVTADWTHLAMTMSSNDGGETGEVVTYINGVEATSIAYDTESLLDSSVDICLGTKAGALTVQNFRGQMDDVILLGEALSPGMIANIYANSGASVPEPSSVALLLAAFAGFCTLLRRKRA